MNFVGSMPPCPRVLPVTRVKRKSSSCSQYHSEESWIKASNRLSHDRSSSSRFRGVFGLFLASKRLLGKRRKSLISYGTPARLREETPGLASGLRALAEHIGAACRPRAQVLRRNARGRAELKRRLPCPAGIPEEASRERNHVGLALCDDFLGLPRFGD